MVSKYNQFMGGVDLADMHQLHCNSTIMGQNRWWLKLFFYLLDVGTSNVLVLYKLAKKPDADAMSIVKFKELLVQSFVRSRLDPVPDHVCLPEHLPVKAIGRFRCVHGALFSKKSCTRFRCSAPDCRLPLCSLGSSVVGQDCFTLCHANDTIHRAAKVKYEAMKVTMNKST